MNVYLIPVTWTYAADLFIEANSLEEAKAKVMDDPLPEGTYMDDSFEVNEAAVESYPFKDRNGHPIIPLVRVRVFDNPEGDGPRYEAITVDCTQDPIKVSDTSYHYNLVPAKNIVVTDTDMIETIIQTIPNPSK